MVRPERAGQSSNAGAGAYAYMHITGIVALGLMWLRMAQASAAQLTAGSADTAFYEAKLVTARYFGERFTPDAGALRRKLRIRVRGDDGAFARDVRPGLIRLSPATKTIGSRLVGRCGRTAASDWRARRRSPWCPATGNT